MGQRYIISHYTLYYVSKNGNKSNMLALKKFLEVGEILIRDFDSFLQLTICLYLIICSILCKIFDWHKQMTIRKINLPISSCPIFLLCTIAIIHFPIISWAEFQSQYLFPCELFLSDSSQHHVACTNNRDFWLHCEQTRFFSQAFSKLLLWTTVFHKKIKL